MHLVNKLGHSKYCYYSLTPKNHFKEIVARYARRFLMNVQTIDIANSRYSDIHFYNSSIESCEFPAQNFDLVFTVGTLIHINPSALPDIIKKILSLSKQYVFGHESFSESITEVFYRNSNNLYWKQNFPQLFKNIYTNLTMVKEKKIQYLNSNLSDICYLFQK